MPAASVQCCVTSPPYWGLRDYGTATWEGGDRECEHAGEPKPRNDTHGPGDNHGRFANSRGTQPSKSYSIPVRSVCLCGAVRIDHQLGLESTPEEYVASMVEVFREVRRVLRDDGAVWLNLGDSYNGSGGVGDDGKQHTNQGAVERPDNRAGWNGLKPKDLVGIPWRVAFALQADGWWLRSDIIWHKPNPMPESVTDRPTKAHEYIFLLAKSKTYYYDADAIAEPAVRRTRIGLANWDKPVPDTRNKRTVWTVTTKPYAEAHFATFPPKLIEPCILAGTSEKGCCSQCGAAWLRVMDRKPSTDGRDNWAGREHSKGGTSRNGGFIDMEYRTVGWRPACDCAADLIPCTVLDPFAGSATSGVVALRNGRDFVGIELNPDYCEMARRRIKGDAPLFNEEVDVIERSACAAS